MQRAVAVIMHPKKNAAISDETPSAEAAMSVIDMVFCDRSSVACFFPPQSPCLITKPHVPPTAAAATTPGQLRPPQAGHAHATLTVVRGQS